MTVILSCTEPALLTSAKSSIRVKFDVEETTPVSPRVIDFNDDSNLEDQSR